MKRLLMSGGVTDPSIQSALVELSGKPIAECTALCIPMAQFADDATITSATVTLREGTVTNSNVGDACDSGRLVRIKLIGDFPHIVTTGHPVESSGATAASDFTVRAVVLTADAVSGRACLKEVQTGEVACEPGAVDLTLD